MKQSSLGLSVNQSCHQKFYDPHGINDAAVPEERKNIIIVTMLYWNKCFCYKTAVEIVIWFFGDAYLDEHESRAFPRNAASCHTETGFPFEFLEL